MNVGKDVRGEYGWCKVCVFFVGLVGDYNWVFCFDIEIVYGVYDFQFIENVENIIIFVVGWLGVEV